jgi:hypothetical protein
MIFVPFIRDANGRFFHSAKAKNDTKVISNVVRNSHRERKHQAFDRCLFSNQKKGAQNEQNA